MKDNKRREFWSDDHGFTLVELFLVMGILALLATLALPTLTDITYKVKVARAQTEIRGIEQEISAFVTEKNALPDSLSDLGRPNIVDPWGNNYRYYNIIKNGKPGAYEGLIMPGATANTDFDLYSIGQDGVAGSSLVNVLDVASKDDIVRASDGAYIGLGELF